MGTPPIKKLCACISNIFLIESSITASSLSSMAFSNPQSDAKDPLIRASCVFRFTANNAPFAGEFLSFPE